MSKSCTNKFSPALCTMYIEEGYIKIMIPTYCRKFQWKYRSPVNLDFLCIRICFMYILFVTNLVFPHFFHNFFSFLAVEKETRLFIGPKQGFSPFRTDDNFVFFFNSSKWEKFVEKQDWWFDVTSTILDKWKREKKMEVHLFYS